KLCVGRTVRSTASGEPEVSRQVVLRVRACRRDASLAGSMTELAENRLEHRQHHPCFPAADYEIPQRFELLPAGRVREMTKGGEAAVVRRCTSENCCPPIEVAIGLPVAVLELFAGKPARTKHGVASVVSIPIMACDSTLRGHASMETRAWVRRQNMKRRCLDAVRDRPIHSSFEHRSIVGIHAENEAAVDHHAEIVQTLDRAGIVSSKVLILPLLDQIRRIQRFETDEQASKTALDRSLEQTGHEDGIDGAGSLPQAPHSAHPVEQAR